MDRTPATAPQRASARLDGADSDVVRTATSVVRRLTLPDGAVTRQTVFSGLAVILLLNAISEKASHSLAQGALPAVFNTFDISLIIWGAAVAAIVLLWRDAPARLTRADLAVGAGIGLAALVPVPTLSALALSGLALWLYQSSPADGLSRRAASILLALTVPLMWARLVFAIASGSLLRLDSLLISLVLGTTPNGNVVPFADGSGSLFIAPGCSSFTNVSLAVLSSAAIMAYYGRKWSWGAVGWSALACLVVIAINVGRISMIGYFPAEYDLIHGEIGATLAGWLTLAAILVVGFQGVRSDAIAAR